MNVWGEYQMLMKSYFCLSSRNEDEVFERIQKLQLLFYIIKNNPDIGYQGYYQLYKEKNKNMKAFVRKQKLQRLETFKK